MQKMNIVYTYVLKDFNEISSDILKQHQDYWKAVDSVNFRSGLFEDNSGSLMIFESFDIDEVTKIINGDPFVSGNYIKSKTIKRWIIKRNTLQDC
jgi:uncharacterized protein YciI